MSNLPITANPSPAAIASKSNSTAGDNGAQQNQPFGEVLARQVAAPVTAEGKISGKKMSNLSLAKVSTSQDETSVTSVAPLTTTATFMLAALLPQSPTQTRGAIAGSETENGLPVALAGRKEAQGLSGLLTDFAAASATATSTHKILAASNHTEIPFAETFVAQTDASKLSASSVGDKYEQLLIASPLLPDNETLAALQSPAINATSPAILSNQAVVINTPVTHDRWGDDFNQKITWLATNKEQSAELHLNPPELGPLDVVLKVSGDQATALFTSPHAAVRDAIEQAIPKLREMLADNGIMLGNATVNDQPTRNNNHENDFGSRSQNGAANRTEIPIASLPEAGSVRVTNLTRHNNVVDTFA